MARQNFSLLLGTGLVFGVGLALAGDVMLGRNVAEAIAARGFGSPWGDVMPLIREADLFLINLECALTRSAERWHDGRFKAFYFRAGPEVVETLRLARVDFACLANNHAVDKYLAVVIHPFEIDEHLFIFL
jgi:poly-gamma-glutamate synthesis protein (capsule biosynthesis protein)